MSNATSPEPSGARSVAPVTSAWHRFSAAAPAGDDLPTDVAIYGSDIPDEATLRLLGNLDGKRILDLGCGVGHAAIAFAQQGAKVIAVDPSAEQVAAGKEAAEEAKARVEFHQADMADLAFIRADGLDAVFSAYAFTEVVDLNRVFRQVHRVLRSESPLVFSLPHPTFTMFDPTAEDPLRLARSYFDRDTTTWTRGDRDVVDQRRTIGDVFTALLRANFRVDQILEPEPRPSSRRSARWSDLMHHVPATVIYRARKLGI
jgi:SAM-dependent methyltransferase